MLSIDRLSEMDSRVAEITYNAVANILFNSLSHICPFVQDVYYPELREQNVRKTIAARDGKNVIGGLLWKYDEPTESLVIRYLGVLEYCKRGGVGSALVNEAVKLAGEFELNRVTLETVEPRAGEIDLPTWYQKRGFEKRGVFDNTCAARKYVMMERSLARV